MKNPDKSFVPNSLSYPEIFSKENRFNTEAQLVKMLKLAIRSGKTRLQERARKIDFESLYEEKFAPEVVCQKIVEILWLFTTICQYSATYVTFYDFLWS